MNGRQLLHIGGLTASFVLGFTVCEYTRGTRGGRDVFMQLVSVPEPSDVKYRREDVYETGPFGVDGYRLCVFGADESEVSKWMRSVATRHKKRWVAGPVSKEFSLLGIPRDLEQSDDTQFMLFESRNPTTGESVLDMVLICDLEKHRVWLYALF
jgi:hypothetical protein